MCFTIPVCENVVKSEYGGGMATKLTPTDVVLHPVRLLRIVQAFLGDRELTTGELRSELRDVATATLYRQVAAMVDGGVLEVADERRVRGAVRAHLPPARRCRARRCRGRRHDDHG